MNIEQAINTYELNVLDILNEREVYFKSPHFATILVDTVYEEKIKQWVRKSLKGRFFLLNFPVINDQEKLKTNLMLGLEQEQELTYFILACPYHRR